jgi:hypothetical protein
MSTRKREVTYGAPVKGKDFTELMRVIPERNFVAMVSKSGLPAQQARELCLAFKELMR